MTWTKGEFEKEKKKILFWLKGNKNFISQVPWIKNKKNRKKKFRMGGARSKKGSPETQQTVELFKSPSTPPQ